MCCELQSSLLGGSSALRAGTHSSPEVPPRQLSPHNPSNITLCAISSTLVVPLFLFEVILQRQIINVFYVCLWQCCCHLKFLRVDYESCLWPRRLCPPMFSASTAHSPRLWFRCSCLYNPQQSNNLVHYIYFFFGNNFIICVICLIFAGSNNPFHAKNKRSS